MTLPTSTRQVTVSVGQAEPELTTEPGHDADLLRRLRQRDEAAYARLVREHAGRLLAVARRYLRNDEDCADAVQEAFLSAFRSLGTFEGSSSLSTWLHRIVVNACLMKLRSQARHPALPIDDLLPTFDETGHHTRPVADWTEQPADRLARAETRKHVRACIEQLPEPYRTVLLLRDIEELDTEETADLLGISRPAVKTRLHRARQALRTLLEPRFCPAGT